MSDENARPEYSATAPSAAYWACYPPVTLMLRGVLRCLAPRYRVTGRGNLPRSGPVLLAPNHIADVDPPVVMLSACRPLWFMAKRELFEMPVLGKFISFAQAFPVERGGADRVALKRAETLLKAGQGVVVFPEGRLSENGELQPLLPGVALLALRAGVPVVPVGLWGTNAILPYGHTIPRPTFDTVGVHFGPALDFSELQTLPSREQRSQAMQHLEDALKNATAMAGN